MSSKKNILLFNPSFSASNMYLPYFWASAKTYYEHQGKYPNDYDWVNPLFNFYNDVEQIKSFIRNNPPAVFGVSLYVWNHTIALQIASWVKETYPDCVVISGGPHQYFKHETSWFQDNPFLDASLAGDDYGEVTICDILDNLDNLSWNQIHAVVYPNKNKKLILHSKKNQNKRSFWWDYSAYASQYQSLNIYRHLLEQYNSSYRAQGLLETTRGCPYACTFCDWGGGTAAKVIAKDIKYVQQDIDYLARLDLNGVFFCDANFGILKDRDVSIMRYIADVKKQHNRFFTLNYGGYAKTPKALPYIKKILEIEAQNYLTRALTYKLSIQTLDQETLQNIDRTDVSFEHYLELSKFLQNNYGYDAYAEIIAGLPGITLDKFYHEINVFDANNITMNFYDWYLLPETPSYKQEYRNKYLIETVKKLFGLNDTENSYNNEFERESEIVVSSYSYTKQDYLEMWISYAWYRAFWTAGFLQTTIKQTGLSLGDFTKIFYNSFFTNSSVSGTYISKLNDNINQVFANFIDPNDHKSKFLITTDYIKDSDPVRLITLLIFMRLNEFKQNIANWVHTTWPTISLVDVNRDLDSMITFTNLNTKKGLLIKRYYYHEVFADSKDLDTILQNLSVYLSSSIPVPPLKFLRSKRTLF